MMARKQALRAQFKERLLSGEGTLEQAEQAASLLIHSMAFRDARAVMLYMAIGGEIDTRGIMDEAFARGKRVGLPRCEAGGRMHAHEVTPRTALVLSRYGIWEPPADAPVMAPDEAQLIVVPALAYDRAGYRLGRGAGYYDRYLSGVRTPKAGLCYAFQLVAELPREKHDARMDMLFTDAGAFVPGGMY